MNFYTVADDWNGYAKTASAYIRNYGDSDALVLNNIASVFYENVTDTAYLDTAILWAARSVALDPMYYNTDTYAALLYKRGRKAEALVMCERALSLPKKRVLMR